jgi:hypothetical protein
MAITNQDLQANKLQRVNNLTEIDPNNGRVYVFIHPYHPKQFDFKITKTETIKSHVGEIHLDFCGNYLAGIEIEKSLTKN